MIKKILDLIFLYQGSVEVKNTALTPHKNIKSYGGTLGYALVTTLFAWPLKSFFNLTNIVMLFILYVVFIALKYGSKPAALASLISVLLFDFFFIPPLYSFAVSDVQDLVMFGVMLFVGLVIGQLTAKLKSSLLSLSIKESRTQFLFELTRDLSACNSVTAVVQSGQSSVSRVLHGNCQIFTPTNKDIFFTDNSILSRGDTPSVDEVRRIFQTDMKLNLVELKPALNGWYLIPLSAHDVNLGVLAWRSGTSEQSLNPDHLYVLENMCRQISIALERVKYVEITKENDIQIQSEKLRNTLLASISHDLRTPLTALMGYSESLYKTREVFSHPHQEAVTAIYNESLQLIAQVTNLLDMAKLQSGKLNLSVSWQYLEEVLASAIRLTNQRFPFFTAQLIVNKCPLIQCDAVLMERLFINLFENTIKYGLNDEVSHSIEIRVDTKESFLNVFIRDFGSGFPSHTLEDSNYLFEKFTRGSTESNSRGVGLGLAICKAIIQVHAGSISAGNCKDGGAFFEISLPLNPPPDLSHIEINA